MSYTIKVYRKPNLLSSKAEEKLVAEQTIALGTGMTPDDVKEEIVKAGFDIAQAVKIIEQINF